MWWLNFLFAVLVCDLPLYGASTDYNFAIDMGNPEVLCPGTDFICKNGNKHYACEVTPRVYAKCICFQPVEIPHDLIRTFLRGTNGIRNKVALQYGIGNMNVVYWSPELTAMAARYLLECTVTYDKCLAVGEKALVLSQNIAILKGELGKRWTGRVVRLWYLELGADVKSWEDARKKIKAGKIGNFSNMVYPLTEFMGCAAARINLGTFVTCFYNPAFNLSNIHMDFQFGPPCSVCSFHRNTCSKLFSGLCGIDYEVLSAPSMQINWYLNVCLGIIYILLDCWYLMPIEIH